MSKYIAVLEDELNSLQAIKEASQQLFAVRTNSPEWEEYLEALRILVQETSKIE